MQISPNSAPQPAQAATPVSESTVQKLRQAVKAAGEAVENARAVSVEDKSMHKVLPGGCVIPPRGLFDGPAEIVDSTLDRARAKHPGAQRDALESFYSQIDQMTPGELDDIKDTIVKRMGSHESSQWDRDLLQKMYQIADAVSENRLPPHVRKPAFEYIIKPIIHPNPPLPAEPRKPFPKDTQIEEHIGQMINKAQDD